MMWLYLALIIIYWNEHDIFLNNSSLFNTCINGIAKMINDYNYRLIVTIFLWSHRVIWSVSTDWGGRVMVFNATWLRTIFQLYRGGQFYRLRKPEYLDKTTTHILKIIGHCGRKHWTLWIFEYISIEFTIKSNSCVCLWMVTSFHTVLWLFSF
jgi:hypothetical protein